jgi:hypothetical protein
MNTKFISTYKGAILRGKSGKSAIMRSPAVAPAPAPAPPKASSQVVAMNGGISVEDIRAVKAVVEKVGAEPVKELANVLAN